MAGIWLLLRGYSEFSHLFEHTLHLLEARGHADSLEHVTLAMQHFRDTVQPDFGKGSTYVHARHSFCAEIKGTGFSLEQPPNMLLAFQRHQPNHCFSRNTKTSTSIHPALYLYGRFSCQVRDQEVHGDVLAVDVLIHHVANGLRHHVGVQVGVVLERIKKAQHCSRWSQAASAHHRWCHVHQAWSSCSITGEYQDDSLGHV